MERKKSLLKQCIISYKIYYGLIPYNEDTNLCYYNPLYLNYINRYFSLNIREQAIKEIEAIMSQII